MNKDNLTSCPFKKQKIPILLTSSMNNANQLLL